MKQRNFFLPILAIVCVLTIFIYSVNAQTNLTTLQNKYRDAVQDAAIVESREIVNTLVPITKENDQLVWNKDKTKVLVITWKSQSSYEKYIKPFTNTSKDESRVIWVTVAPQLQEFCQQHLKNNPRITDENLKMRLRQYLGLDPQWQYDLFVEMWVSPQDLFRPCVDPDISKTECSTDFQKDINPQVLGITPDAKIKDYKAFYQNLYYQSIRSGVQPWTGLGYTYDWGDNATHVGASEFILIPGANYVINKTEPTWKYCQ
jgi:hypothetical protein